MPRIAIAVIAAALLALPAGADGAPDQRVRAGLEELGARLALTPEQRAKARPILEEHFEALAAALDRHGVSPDDRSGADTVDLQRMRALREELRAGDAALRGRLAGILSEAQMAEFGRIRAEREEALRDRILSKGLDEIAAALGLTPEQADRARPVLREHFEAQMAVLDRHGIAPGDGGDRKRPGFRTLRRLRKELGENNEKTLERLSAILSQAQLAAYEALQAERREKLRALLSRR